MHYLDVDKIDVFYGESQALWELSIHVDKGEIISVLGSNGAGKSTLINTISGVKYPAKGSVVFENNNIEKQDPYKIVSCGLVQVPEGKKIFRMMNVLDNLKLGGHTQRTTKEDLESVFNLFPILKERKTQVAGLLSGGEQQMLAIARALMARPKVLMLDEVSQGLAPKIVSQIFQALKDINREGVTILLVEQNIRLALSIAQRVYVLETGRVKFSGLPEELQKSDIIVKSYLGI